MTADQRLQEKLAGCIVLNEQNTVLGSKRLAISVRLSVWASKDKW